MCRAITQSDERQRSGLELFIQSYEWVMSIRVYFCQWPPTASYQSMSVFKFLGPGTHGYQCNELLVEDSVLMEAFVYEGKGDPLPASQGSSRWMTPVDGIFEFVSE